MVSLLTLLVRRQGQGGLQGALACRTPLAIRLEGPGKPPWIFQMFPLLLGDLMATIMFAHSIKPDSPLCAKP